jgi:hypothetical protein
MLLSEFLSTLEYHNTLNLHLFDGFVLKPYVKDKLLEITKLFQNECNIKDKLIQDILLVGGNANYNFTSLSDIDIHILVDYTEINSGELDLEDYFKIKKDVWADTHNVTIHGYPVEFYVQNLSESTPKDQGVYSLLSDKFIIAPRKVKVNYNDPKLLKKLTKYIDLISTTNDIMGLKLIKTKLKDYRTAGLQRGGEFSFENITWKELRNLGWIDKLDKKYRSVRDKQLSI